MVARLSPRPKIACIAWVREDSRSSSIARALDGEARTFYDLGLHAKPLVPLRYVLSAVRTVAYLLRRRPRAVMIQAPPVPAVAIVWAWSRLAGVPLLIDSHPASFGTEDARADRVMRPVLAWLVPRAAGCIVTTPRLGEQISRWGGRPIVVHEAPMPWADRVRQRGCSGERRVLFVCTFAPDEPVMQALDAAARLPEVKFAITGDLRRLPEPARRAAPDNVQWVGYLNGADYVLALERADVIMSLTARAESVARSAHEGVDALRPMVISGGPHMRDLFPCAVFVENQAESIAVGVAEALRRCEELSERAIEARSLQHRRWREQLADIHAALDAARTGRRPGTAARWVRRAKPD
jgi:glycosyltransferase involved in cell wall biosynthesis